MWSRRHKYSKKKEGKVYDFRHVNVAPRKRYRDAYSWTEALAQPQTMQIVIGEKTTVTENIFDLYSFILFKRMLLLILFFLTSSVIRIERKSTAKLSKNVL